MDDDLGARLDDRVTPPSDLPVLSFPDQSAFEQWLEAEHQRSPGDPVDAQVLAAKVVTGRFFAEQLLPQVHGGLIYPI